MKFMKQSWLQCGESYIKAGSFILFVNRGGTGDRSKRGGGQRKEIQRIEGRDRRGEYQGRGWEWRQKQQRGGVGQERKIRERKIRQEIKATERKSGTGNKSVREKPRQLGGTWERRQE
jgi:hypothetical protein